VKWVSAPGAHASGGPLFIRRPLVNQEQPYTFEPVSKLTLGDNSLLPSLSDEEYAALKADVKKNGVVVPISIDEDYVVIDGHHRLRACNELGLDRVPTRTHSQLDPAEQRDLALVLNLNRRNLSQEEKRHVIAAVLRQHPDHSDRRVADAAGVDHKTVASVRTELEQREEIPHVAERKDSKGRKQPARKTKQTARKAKGPKEGEVTLPIRFEGRDAELPKRIQRIAEESHVSTEAWCVRVLREAVEAVEGSQPLAA
jgi:ParB-like chromosome segregation protein Spo0J